MSDWSNELVLELLELYQAEPAIYDPKHPAHKNKMKVNDAWMRIKRALGVDVSVAEIKKERLPHGIFPLSFEKEEGVNEIWFQSSHSNDKRAVCSRCVDGYIRPRMFGESFVVESR
jgi:hypothetical protein